MMNKKILYILLLLSTIHLSSSAQVDKQVEVTKAYIPEITPSEKLALEPDMSDTVRLRPEIDYSITPRTLATSLETKAYRAATVTYWEFNRPQRGYIKAGVGVPISSVADIYVSNANPNTNYFIGYINHEGDYAKLKNDFNERVSTTNTQNRIGGAAGVYLGDKILEGEIHYDLDYWSRYATSNPIITHPLYQTLALQGRYGDDFINLSKWQYNINFNASQFFSHKDNNNTTLSLFTKFGGKIRNGELLSRVGYEYVGSNYNYINNSALLSIIYRFSRGHIDIDLGGEYIYDYISTHTHSSRKNYFIPHVVLRKTSNPSIEPFISIIGDIERNGYAALVDANPYIEEGLYLDRSSVDYAMSGGISGALNKGRLKYDLSLNYTITKDARYWALIESYYYAERANLQGLSANINLEYRPISSLLLELEAEATKWITSDKTELSAARPSAELYLGGEYSTNRLRYGVSVEIKGISYTTLITNANQEAVQTPTSANLRAFIDYTLKNKVTLFLEGENLANADIYEWMGYRQYGVGVMAGVKIQF